MSGDILGGRGSVEKPEIFTMSHCFESGSDSETRKMNPLILRVNEAPRMHISECSVAKSASSLELRSFQPGWLIIFLPHIGNVIFCQLCVSLIMKTTFPWFCTLHLSVFLHWSWDHSSHTDSSYFFSSSLKEFHNRYPSSCGSKNMISDLLDFWDLKFNPKATEQIAPPLSLFLPLFFLPTLPFSPRICSHSISQQGQKLLNICLDTGGAWISSGYRGGLESALDTGGLGFVKQ